MSGSVAANAVAVLAGFSAGALLGFLHFGLLWWNVRLYASGGVIAASGLQMLRFILIAAGLWGLARLGSLPLLASAPGVLLARGALLRHLGRSS